MSNTAELRGVIAADADLMQEARGWTADVTGADTSFWSTALVLATIANQYSGGLLAFQANSTPHSTDSGYSWCDACNAYTEH